MRTLVGAVAIERFETQGFGACIARAGDDVGVVKIKGEDAVDHVMGNELQEVGVAGRNAAVAIAWLCPERRTRLVSLAISWCKAVRRTRAIAADVTIGSAGPKAIARGHLAHLQ